MDALPKVRREPLETRLWALQAGPTEGEWAAIAGPVLSSFVNLYLAQRSHVETYSLPFAASVIGELLSTERANVDLGWAMALITQGAQRIDEFGRSAGKGDQGEEG